MRNMIIRDMQLLEEKKSSFQIFKLLDDLNT